MPGDPGPMVRRRQLGSALRRYRGQAGMTVNNVAERLLCSPTKISRIETAQRNASLRDVRDLCDIYGISDEKVREQLMDLARGSRERGWWWQDSNLDPALETLIGMEGSAYALSEFEPLALPGLVQTRDYADAILNTWLPDDPAGRELAVDVRMKRQKLLGADSRPVIHVVLDEAALRRVIGDPTVMRKQLEHLIDLVSGSTISLQVIPFLAGAHLGMSNGFTILEFSQSKILAADPAIPAVVYAETLTGGVYFDQSAIVQAYVEAFTRLRAQALTVDESFVLLRAVTREL